MKQGVVKLKRVAQDGTKVRASAGAASFKRKQSLERALMEAEQQVRRLKREMTDDPSAASRRVAAAKERAARARQQVVEAAPAEIPLFEEKREAQAKKEGKRLKEKEVRASTTDAERRVMKMADGRFRSAFNVQWATDVDGGCIVGVEVTNNGTDQPHVVPMLSDIEQRTGQVPKEYLMDGGFVSLANIEVLAERDAVAYAPVPEPRNETVERYAPKEDDSPAVAAWRVRMGSDTAKRISVQRGAAAERTNADLRGHRGLDRLKARARARHPSAVGGFTARPTRAGSNAGHTGSGSSQARRVSDLTQGDESSQPERATGATASRCAMSEVHCWSAEPHDATRCRAGPDRSRRLRRARTAPNWGGVRRQAPARPSPRRLPTSSSSRPPRSSSIG